MHKTVLFALVILTDGAKPGRIMSPGGVRRLIRRQRKKLAFVIPPTIPPGFSSKVMGIDTTANDAEWII